VFIFEVGRRFRQLDTDRIWGWAYVVSNHGPLPCEGSALPLSYTPQQRVTLHGTDGVGPGVRFADNLGERG
jgi:hypothetical protein